ncbi:endo-alpha-N-acetylgalactosaminidase family protein [Tyzzerella nexilis]|nr:endo-alpha-N-acetylgalactosaminidase family protein [[Clostridium] nexile]MCB7556570.1 endo-alpha-N-acetylgalactosaminidase family protein [[Clostridium] nexile]MCC3674671.1 endo-alpha-N-acetylgalactosaminidase family protein [[Clostridium] nexile]NSD84961.1 TonB-dependent receptor [[Clostridium] nexile]NSD87293.1 TonB-dependent receptor [[Clostridium] nexile]
MKKKMVLRLLSLAMVASMTGTMLPSNLQIVSAEESVATEEKAEKAEETAVLEDGINDAWTLENEVDGDKAAVESGWLHIKSAPGNRNNPGTNPLMVVNPNTFDFSKAGYISFTLKSNNGNTNINDCDRVGVYLGYNTDQNGMYIGYDNGGWFWQKYKGGNGDYFQSTRKPAPKKDQEVTVRIDWTADHKMTFTLNDEVVFDKEDFSGIADSLGTKIAIKAGSWGELGSDVLIKDIHYTGQEVAATHAVTGKVTDADGKALEGATVTVGDQKATTDKEGSYSLKLAAGTYDLTVAKTGYQTATKSVTVANADVKVEDVKLEKVSEVETEKLSTDDMDVYVAKNFPSVVRYEMKKGDLKGKTFYGQTSEINTIRINGTDIKLSKDNVKATFEGKKATYEMTVKNEAKNIDAVITAELVAKDNTVAFEITKVENKLEEAAPGKAVEKGKLGNPIQTIEIPNHSLVSVNSTQEGANLVGAAMSTKTQVSGDEYVEVNANTPARNRDYMYAFVSNNEMSAGLWSNSEYEGRNAGASSSGGSSNTRVMSTSEQKDGYVSMGLGSSAWYWHRVMTDSHNRTWVLEETETPKMKVVIAGDSNEDTDIDWQDGAVAFRDIMNNPFKSEEVPELVAYRIAMNFGSHAQNPFLTTLDNVKRVAMHTDGLGQSVLLKGYANEGHDSAHPDYADIGKRIGGPEDMKTLMEKGAEYGAKFGIHVNAGEMYPEAKAFKDENVRRNPNGSLRYGWNWIDQGIGLDSIYDLATGEREARFDQLHEILGGDGKDMLDFIYVDIWGNNTGSSLDDSQQTRKLSKEINDNGWRMSNEWGGANEYDSTFQHWATDLTYGGKDAKGENSDVMRFLRNHQKDSWVGDYPAYGGAAVAPLLGGYNMKDFEGWQGRNDYDAYITNLYTHDLTTKFIQHYEVVDWVDGEPVNVGGAANWTPEMKITLKDKDGSTLVLERGSNDPSNAAYRNRTMTLDGKVIATGAVSQGDRTDNDIRNGNKKGTEKYLLPWIWDAKTGEKVKAEDEKLYHWNTQGGTSEWELPDSWSGLQDVKVYKLTDLGKTEEKTVKVVDGKITLEAESEVPYVVCKGQKENIKVTWSEGMHIVDAGFNSGKLDMWKKEGEGTAKIAKSQHSNPMMKLDGKVSMTQELTELEAGKQYAVLVGVDNRSDAKASVEIKSGDKVLASNYTTRSIAKNYVKAYTHNTNSSTVNGNSYFQNMYVFFTAPESGKVTLTISRAAGEGSSYFDDIRIVENDSKNITTNDKGEVVKFEQDFEKSVQGLYPFVVGGIEGVEDNRIHLSERHGKYTQAGWDVKKMDDVLDGDWSVKINGLTQRSTLAYQTIPQNFRFEPGVTYNVSFDYQAGSDGIYAAAVGVGEYNGNVQLKELKKAMGENTDGHYTTQITGDSTGQTWFGIYSTDKAPDLQGVDPNAAEANFGGYKELVLDNLVIEKVTEEVTKEKLAALVTEAEGKYKEIDYRAEIWSNYQNVLKEVKAVLNKEGATQAEIEEAYYNLKGMMVTMDNSKGIDPTDDSKDLPKENMTATTGSQQSETGSEGPASNVLDGDSATIWHTVWAGTPIANHWLNLKLDKPATVSGFRLQQRSGRNGVIKEAEIWVKTVGAEDYVKVADASFGGSGWQGLAFEAVQNVTDVKLVPTATLGDAANKFSAAAEIRVMGEFQDAVIEADKSDLNAAIEYAKSQQAKDEYQYVVPVVKEKFEAALAEAEKVNADATATQETVDAAYENLLEMIHHLDFTGNTSELKVLVDVAKGLNEEVYTPETWAPFAEALKAAEAVLADENALQSDIDDAKNALQTAMNALKKIPVDKSELEKLVNRVDGKYDLSKYTKETADIFKAALDAAKAVLADENATQAQVQAAHDNLRNAEFGLRLIPNKDALEDLINKVENMDLSKYSDDVQKEIRSALDNAKAVMADENATQDDVDGAVKLLQASVDKAEGTTATDNKKPSTSGKDQSKDKAAKTGDATSPIGWGVAGILGVFAAVVAFFERKKRRQ